MLFSLPIRRLVRLASTFALALALPIAGQNPPTTETTFSARAELVTVPVVVTDKSGAHFQNLKKEDFVLLEDGKAQNIANFEEIVKPGSPVQPVTRQPNQFSNVLVQGAVPMRLTILVLDLINTPFEDRIFAEQEILKYLADSVDSSTPTSLFVIGRSGLKILHDFTTDPAALAAALKKRPGDRPAVQEASQEAITTTDPGLAMMMKREIESEQRMESLERRTSIILTLEAMQQIAQSLAGLPGRKAVLWASAGFPFSINEADMVINIAGVKGDSLSDVSGLYQKTWRDLNQAQVSVYPVDVRGLVNPTVADVSIRDPNSTFYSHNIWKQTETLGTFQTFAQATGGRAFYNTNDLKTAFQKASDDNASYYLLSYYLNRKDKKPGWHKLTVKVHREGTQIRARTGFFLDQDNAQQTDKSELQIALASPLEYTAIPITGEWQKVSPAAEPGKKQVIFMLTMPASFATIDEPANNHMQIQIAAVARTPTGTAAGETVKTMDAHLKPESMQQIRTHGLDYRGALTLPPGEYTVHFAVQDQLNGRVGSVTAPLKVEP